jgi:hypothetical protein
MSRASSERIRDAPARSTSPDLSKIGSCPHASRSCDDGRSLIWVRSEPEFIKVLRLLQSASLRELSAAVEQALSIDATNPDAIHLILLHRAERPVGLFSLDGHPHLKWFAIDPPDLGAYRVLTQIGA